MCNIKCNIYALFVYICRSDHHPIMTTPSDRRIITAEPKIAELKALSVMDNVLVISSVAVAVISAGIGLTMFIVHLVVRYRNEKDENNEVTNFNI